MNPMAPVTFPDLVVVGVDFGTPPAVPSWCASATARSSGPPPATTRTASWTARCRAALPCRSQSLRISRGPCEHVRS